MTNTTILCNGKGDYLYLNAEPKTRYEGFYVNSEGKEYRTIAEIKHKQPVNKIINMFYAVQRQRKETTEEYVLGEKAFSYTLDQEQEFEIMLDCKESRDNREWGRSYEISHEGKTIVIKYSKTNDNKEPIGEEYTFYLAIEGANAYLPVQNWERQDYELDKRRNSPPHYRYLFNAMKLKAEKIGIGFGLYKKQAIENAKKTLYETEKIKQKKEKEISNLFDRQIADKKIDTAYKCALASLNSLTNTKGILAGMPWFYEHWARDEIISAVALPTEKAKKIILKHLNTTLTKPGATLKSKDLPGWTAIRAGQLWEELEKNEKREILQKIKPVDGLISNGPLETWMDTRWEDDTREGECIEIQALNLAIMKLHQKDTAKLKNEIRKKFWNGKCLKDKTNEDTIRPNIFIAAYAYPELLTTKEWTTCFRNALKELWLEWGGLATISKKHRLFSDEYTGEDNKSYHRGDSWFWLNNLAATVMHNINSAEFSKEIQRIIDASTQEILEEGAAGHHAEISSASRLESNGCLAQAWSAAMYVEMIREVYKLKSKR